ncbi:MAG: hypothetical protein J6C19_12675 [Lachnospiraceae bacterium]|nr:hypothetical protein [Lachnospiraceae bacterium]
MMKKYVKVISVAGIMAVTASGCGKEQESEPVVVKEFEEILPDNAKPVIVRDEENTAESTAAMDSMEDTETSAEAETETEAYADRIAGENAISYDIESSVYEEGVVHVEYPQLTGMESEESQQKINENIRNSVLNHISAENLSFYELGYETATKGDGIVSFIFRGSENTVGSAYPRSLVKTLNIDLNTGRNVRLKDFADISAVVSSLELADGYMVLNEGVDMADFSAFLNNGYVTDYAMTLLDYDIDFANPDMVPAGYTAIRNNHLILFVEAEHAMGDYVELEFEKDL